MRTPILALVLHPLPVPSDRLCCLQHLLYPTTSTWSCPGTLLIAASPLFELQNLSKEGRRRFDPRIQPWSFGMFVFGTMMLDFSGTQRAQEVSDWMAAVRLSCHWLS